MKIRPGVIATATVIVLTLAMPALGQVVGVYSLRWHAAIPVYATVEGACGRVDASTEENTRKLTVCFGETIDVRHNPQDDSVSRVNLWVSEWACDAEENCSFNTWSVVSPDVTYAIDPLLGTATVQADVGGSYEGGCGLVDVTLTAASEPGLRSNPFVQDPSTDIRPGEGYVEIGAGGSESVGRDATMEGTVCGASVRTDASELWRARIFRGVGSDGVNVWVSYA